jgi:hypothetical protein
MAFILKIPCPDKTGTKHLKAQNAFDRLAPLDPILQGGEASNFLLYLKKVYCIVYDSRNKIRIRSGFASLLDKPCDPKERGDQLEGVQ